MENLTVIGIDIAKNFMQIHGTNDRGKVLLKKRMSREKFLAYMANLPRCVIGMEACGGSNYWALELKQLGFDVRLMSPNKVKKYTEHHKNDPKDAEACAEAVSRANMRFVPIKTREQMEIQNKHRIRSYYVKEKTALSNMMRGLLLEQGIAISQGKAALTKKMRELLADDSDQLNQTIKNEFQGLYEDLKQLDAKIKSHTDAIEKLAKEDEYCKRLCSIPGLGPITSTAVIAKIGNGSEFRKGRELSAYLGLVPRQHSSGETTKLLGISKHGDRYLRQLMIHGARSSVVAATKINRLTKLPEKQDKHSQWIRKLIERVGVNKASVAVANKNARIIVALLKGQTDFNAALAHA
jgi:transposase